MKFILCASLIFTSFLGFSQVVLGPQNSPFRESEYIYKKVDSNVSARPLLDLTPNIMNWDVRNLAITNESKSFYFTQDPSYKSFPINFPSWGIPYPHNFDTSFIKSNGFVYRNTPSGLKNCL